MATDQITIANPKDNSEAIDDLTNSLEVPESALLLTRPPNIPPLLVTESSHLSFKECLPKSKTRRRNKLTEKSDVRSKDSEVMNVSFPDSIKVTEIEMGLG
ncbi:hypothetical protein AMTR_s00030p00147980 [Amborella trichopoda]|uniref:Uncharacterized protein n=1 Tax=Amborella trichopoda TaxID=13333 RepID=U5D1J0_AMBTC|nr:hypothetical protein AMTR_s00030p00147980 [Amborella trichopoda]